MGGWGWPNADVCWHVGWGWSNADVGQKKEKNIYIAIEMLWDSITFPWFRYIWGKEGPWKILKTQGKAKTFVNWVHWKEKTKWPWLIHTSAQKTIGGWVLT